MTTGRGGVVILVLTMVFAAGVGTGMAFDRIRRGSRLLETSASTATFPAELDSLGLTSDQRQRIRVIFGRHAPATDSAVDELVGQLRVLTDSVDSEVRLVLTPAQRARLDSGRAHRPTVVIRRRAYQIGTERRP